MSSETVSRTWRTGRFLIDRSQSLADDALHLYCPGVRDLPVEHLITLALLPIHDWNSALLKVATEGPITQVDTTLLRRCNRERPSAIGRILSDEDAEPQCLKR